MSTATPATQTKTNEVEEKKTKNLNWRIEEDQMLCIIWLNTSKDANELLKADGESSFTESTNTAATMQNVKNVLEVGKLMMKFSAPSSKPYSVKETKDKDEKEDTTLGLSRPEGRKAAKKHKFEAGEALKGQKELIKISKEKTQAMQVVADDAIMSKDTSGMDELSCKFYMAKKKEIAEQMGLL
ncbi:hypothetical protein PCANC_07756 [Puccinia coronata f. sp. avenae]|uniref:No apical meristem-associated C-terminal domain-containing protein n=1 Tax=Puccinia coronata f. sp. avenae TaxID=200324 RepID=A0A2N5VH95_9BASI|nr:hypothetical protein PCANC_07756 [Puccinia coronata f. sp. avenae]